MCEITYYPVRLVPKYIRLVSSVENKIQRIKFAHKHSWTWLTRGVSRRDALLRSSTRRKICPCMSRLGHGEKETDRKGPSISLKLLDAPWLNDKSRDDLNLSPTACWDNELGSLGVCRQLKDCYPYFRLPDVSPEDAWIFGIYNTCPLQHDGKLVFGVCCGEPVNSDVEEVKKANKIKLEEEDNEVDKYIIEEGLDDRRPALLDRSHLMAIPKDPVVSTSWQDGSSTTIQVEEEGVNELDKYIKEEGLDDSRPGLLDRSHLMSGPGPNALVVRTPWQHVTFPPIITHPPSHTDKPWWTTRPTGGGSPKPTTSYPWWEQPTPSKTTTIYPWWTPQTTPRTTTTTAFPWWEQPTTTTAKPWWEQTTTTSTTPPPPPPPPSQTQPGGPVGAEQDPCSPTTFYAAADEESDSKSNPGGFRISGGLNASPHSHPWIAVMFNNQKQFCGGSLIDRTHILTAAHCVAHMSQVDIQNLRVRLGAHNIRQQERTTQEYKVARVVRHKDYDSRRLYNDVAMLTLEKPVRYNSKVRPVCLDRSSSTYEGDRVTVAGWGSMYEGGPQPSTLYKVQLRVWSNEECRTKYGGAAPGGIVPSYLCAGQDGKDSCQGDSGGPLVKQINGVWTQVGIVSWGIGCGKGHYPGVYSRISAFLPWINRVKASY